MVSALGIVGAGRAATLHAEASRLARGMRLIGVAGRTRASVRAKQLATAFDCEATTVAALVRRCDLLVIATPAPQHLNVMKLLRSVSRSAAVLVESPVADRASAVEELNRAASPWPVLAALNLLHAPVVMQMLDILSTMSPHHLELRLRVPGPNNASSCASSATPNGGGVLMNPASGFWPVLNVALGAGIVSVETLHLEVSGGLDRRAVVVLRAANDRSARAEVSWGHRVAQASIEAADSNTVVRAELFGTTLLEINGKPAGSASQQSNPVAALGFVNQLERLARVARGECQPWPDLSAGAAAIMVASAAALSYARGGVPTAPAELPLNQSPLELLRINS